MRAMMDTPHLGPSGVHPVIASSARELLNKSENERSGVLSTAMSFLGLYRDPVVARVTAIREIEAGEEWYLNYKYGSREERDKDGKPWYPAAWCLSNENLAFQYNSKRWVEMLVHPSVYN